MSHLPQRLLTEAELPEEEVDEDFAFDEEELEEDTTDDGTEAADGGNNPPLGSGEALDVREVDGFLLRRGAKIVSIVGDASSGKTTLIGSLYDRFCRGTFGVFAFARSDTLLAFDRQFFESRFDSGRLVPETIRTSTAKGVHFYHLGLVPIDGGRRVDLLLADRSGEDFKAARDRPDHIRTLVEVGKADVIVLLVDGAKVVDLRERHSALQSTHMMLRSILDSGVASGASTIQIVVTKYDMVQRRSDADVVEASLGEFEARLRKSLGHRVAQLDFFRVAARDPERNLPPGWNVDTLLSAWGTHFVRVRSPRPIARESLSTEYDRLLWRPLIEDT